MRSRRSERLAIQPRGRRSRRFSVRPPPEVQPTISAAFCLLKIDCERQEAYLKQALEFGLKDPDGLRRCCVASVHALGMLAVGGRTGRSPRCSTGRRRAVTGA